MWLEQVLAIVTINHFVWVLSDLCYLKVLKVFLTTLILQEESMLVVAILSS